jgi:hypothetical protein
MTLPPANEAKFWRARERMSMIVAEQPGFLALIGGFVANSPLMYTFGDLAPPDLMDQWNAAKVHAPVMHAKKWQRSLEGEQLVTSLTAASRLNS